MKPRSIRICLAGLVLLAFGSFTACGGGGGSSLEDYFEGFDALGEEFDQRGETTQATFNDRLLEIESAQDALDIFEVFINEMMALAADFRDGLQGLDAPDEVSEPHNEMTALFETAVVALEGVSSELAGAEDLADFEQIAEGVETEFNALGTQSEVVCFQLQGIADENDIDVALECGE